MHWSRFHPIAKRISVFCLLPWTFFLLCLPFIFITETKDICPQSYAHFSHRVQTFHTFNLDLPPSSCLNCTSSTQYHYRRDKLDNSTFPVTSYSSSHTLYHNYLSNRINLSCVPCGHIISILFPSQGQSLIPAGAHFVLFYSCTHLRTTASPPFVSPVLSSVSVSSGIPTIPISHAPFVTPHYQPPCMQSSYPTPTATISKADRSIVNKTIAKHGPSL